MAIAVTTSWATDRPFSDAEFAALAALIFADSEQATTPTATQRAAGGQR